jgi:mRNA-degrading endonuclease RelE of RelBE toxin-antitoxin system
MSDFEVTLRPRAVRDFEQLPSLTQERVFSTLSGLGDELRPPGSRRLWLRGAYAVADSDVEIFYTIDVNRGILRIVTIQPLWSASDENESNDVT